jgi:hypothetical protein
VIFNSVTRLSRREIDSKSYEERPSVSEAIQILPKFTVYSIKLDQFASIDELELAKRPDAIFIDFIRHKPVLVYARVLMALRCLLTLSHK